MKTKLGKLNKLTKGSSRKYDKSKFKYDPKVKTEVNANGYKVNLPGYFEKTGKQGITRDRTRSQQAARDATAKVKRTKRAVSKHVKKNAGTYKKGLGVTAIAGIGTAGAVATKKRYDKPENKVRRKLGMKTKW